MICDFNCKIFNVNRFDFSDDARGDTLYWKERFQSDLEILNRCSIHKLVCYARHNEDQNVKNTFERINAFNIFIKNSINNDIFKKFKINVYPKLFLSEDCPYIKNISRLAVGNYKRIFIELPLLPQPEYIDDALNKILYNCRLIPVFTDFQNYNIIYPKNYIDKLIRIRNASFQFSIFKINHPNNIDLVKRIINNSNTVLLGTDADHNTLNEKEIIRNLTLFKKNLSIEVYRDIHLSSNRIFV